MKTRILHTKIYSDSFFVKLTPIEKLLFIYYLTNENVNIIGCYECPDRKTSFDTGIDTSKIHLFQEKVEKAGKMYFKDGYVFLKNTHKYENYSGELNIKAKNSLINQLSIPIREWFEGCVKGVSIPPINHKSEIINQNKGVVKGENSIMYLDEIPPEDLKEFTTKYIVSEDEVLKKAQLLKGYCQMHGKKYKDYRAFLRNAIAGDFKLKPDKPEVILEAFADT